MICNLFPSQRSEKQKLRGWESRRTSTNSTARLPSWTSFSKHYPGYGVLKSWRSCSLASEMTSPMTLFLIIKYHVLFLCTRQIAAEVSAPLAKTDEIVLISGNDSTTADVARLVGQIPPAMAALTGVDVSKVFSKLPGAKVIPPASAK